MPPRAARRPGACRTSRPSLVRKRVRSKNVMSTAGGRAQAHACCSPPDWGGRSHRARDGQSRRRPRDHRTAAGVARHEEAPAPPLAALERGFTQGVTPGQSERFSTRLPATRCAILDVGWYRVSNVSMPGCGEAGGFATLAPPNRPGLKPENLPADDTARSGSPKAEAPGPRVFANDSARRRRQP